MGEINVKQSDTHATPSTGFQKIYPKTNGFWYTKKDDGSEESLLSHHHVTHESGGIDEVPHQSLNGAGTNTHAQIDSHIASTSNPHSVTKTQVGLGNVTDDAQLKRAAGDFATFTEKTTVARADLLLTEDSANGGAKKKVQAQTLMTMVQAAFAEITADTNTTSPTFVDLLTINLTTGASYLHINFTAACDNTNNDKITSFKLEIDGVEQRGVGTTVGNTLPTPVALVYRKQVSAGAHTVKILWKTNANTTRINVVTNSDNHHASLLVQEMVR